MPQSILQKNPKSRISEKGYINVYSQISPQEKRQLHYKNIYKQENPLWDETMVYLSRFFASVLPDNCTVLDAGCGNGNYIIDENRAKIFWADGVDLSEDSVRKNICLDEYKIGSLYSIPFEDNSFDCVLSLWVLEHIEYPERVFSEIARVLRNGGYFLFATPNKNFLPLALKSIPSAERLNGFINRHLFGRNESDVFKTYYKANTPEDILRLAGDKYFVQILKYNYDPSYTSFDGITYRTSILIHKILSFLGLKITEPHLIGVLKKN